MALLLSGLPRTLAYVAAMGEGWRLRTERTQRMNEEILHALDEMRAEVGTCLIMARAIAEKIARGDGGREVSLGITHLQDAGHWFREAAELLMPASHGEASE